MDLPTVRIRRWPHAGDLPLPAPATAGSAGADLRAAVDEELILAPGGRALVPTGFSVEIPAGWEGQVRPRSGLAAQFGLTLLNSPGTIDSDYRGEVRVLLINHGSEPFTVRRGERLAQLVVAPAPRIRFVEVEDLAPSPRGEGGFGSTGRG
ncbi:MAG: dUTP diphosphatase [Thermoanaerobaculia bacterium]|nr:dUTP diphosphatase [Thermoanaerobaculia bacterium]MBP9824915.1 dUTP diphosphatase [Thermoanaerobaculia bacterium]